MDDEEQYYIDLIGREKTKMAPRLTGEEIDKIEAEIQRFQGFLQGTGASLTGGRIGGSVEYQNNDDVSSGITDNMITATDLAPSKGLAISHVIDGLRDGRILGRNVESSWYVSRKELQDAKPSVTNREK